MKKDVKKDVDKFKVNKSRMVSAFSMLFSILVFSLIIILLFINIQKAATCPNGPWDCPTDGVYECRGGQCVKCTKLTYNDCPMNQVPDCDKCRTCITSAECVQRTFGKNISWIIIATIACAIALVGAGIVYMIGYSFDIKNIKQVGKAELMQGIASLLLVGLLFGVDWTNMNLIQMLEKQTGLITASIFTPNEAKAVIAAGGEIFVSPFDISKIYLNKLIQCAQNKYKDTYQASIPDKMLASFSFGMKLMLPFTELPLTITPLYIDEIAERISNYDYLADELTMLIILLYAQRAIIVFAETSMFTVFLPIGIILRAFPPTRGAGAVMIAIAIGFYIVYPVVYTLLAVNGGAVGGCDLKIPPGSTAVTTKGCPIAPQNTAQMVSDAMQSATMFENQVPAIKSGTSQIRFIVYIYFIISLGATFLVVRSIAGIMGADISEIGRSMFKML